jgi:hypothetical protein
LDINELDSERKVFFKSLIKKIDDPKNLKYPVPMIPMDVRLGEIINTEKEALLAKLTDLDLIAVKGKLIDSILNHMIKSDKTG